MLSGGTPEMRRRWIALGIYVAACLVYLLFADPALLHAHTPWNHFALLADAWRQGRLDLGGPPPAYTGHNDFSHLAGKWYVVFPPFPALLLLPILGWAKNPELVRDGLFFLLLA